MTLDLTHQGIFSNVVAGGVAGSVAWVFCIPFDCIKSRIQADDSGRYKNTWDCIVKSYKHEGISVFYRGLLMCCVRGFPAAAVTFLVYSQSLKFFNSLAEDESGNNGGDSGDKPSS